MGDDVQRELGRMQAEIEGIKAGSAEHRKDMKEWMMRIEGKLDELRQDKARLIGAGWVTKAFFGLFGAGTATALIKATAFIR